MAHLQPHILGLLLVNINGQTVAVLQGTGFLTFLKGLIFSVVCDASFEIPHQVSCDLKSCLHQDCKRKCINLHLDKNMETKINTSNQIFILEFQKD